MSDDPTEHAQEEIHEHAHAAHGGGPKWIGYAALFAAFFAALAAIGGSLASSKLTESTRDQIASSDQWGFFQAHSIKEKILLHSATPLTAKDQSDLDDYASRGKIKDKAEELNARSIHALETHETLERGVTFFHISIAIVAIAVLSRRQSFFYGSLFTGAIGIVFLTWGLGLHFSPPHHAGAHESHESSHAAPASEAPGETPVHH